MVRKMAILNVDFRVPSMRPGDKVYIDVLELETPAGEIITLDWTESCYDWENDTGTATLYGVYPALSAIPEGSVVCAAEFYNDSNGSSPDGDILFFGGEGRIFADIE